MTICPDSIAAVDAVWLTAMMHASGTIPAGGAVTGFDSRPLSEGFGQTGTTLRISMRYSGADNGAPASVIAKFATSDSRRREISKSIGLYQREVDFYNQRARNVSVRTPRSYYAGTAEGGGVCALFLEDFPDHRPGDETVGLKIKDAELAITQIAGLHGPYWNRMKDDPLPRLPLAPLDRYAQAWEIMEDSFGDLVPDELRANRDRYLTAIPKLQEWINAGPTTLIHGDFRLDNLLFGPKDSADPFVAVDWQAIRPARGMQDVAYLVSHSMDVEDRRTSESRLLEIYSNALSEYGVKYGVQQATTDYRTSMLYLFCVVLYIVGINVNSHERAVRRKRALMQRAVTSLRDWDALDLLSEFL
jgi:hypothetical protein